MKLSRLSKAMRYLIVGDVVLGIVRLSVENLLGALPTLTELPFPLGRI